MTGYATIPALYILFAPLYSDESVLWIQTAGDPIIPVLPDLGSHVLDNACNGPETRPVHLDMLHLMQSSACWMAVLRRCSCLE
jgi:hypothetical protein